MGLHYTLLLLPSYEDFMSRLEGIGFEETTELHNRFKEFEEEKNKKRDYNSITEYLEDKPKDPELLAYYERMKEQRITHIELSWRKLNKDYIMLHFTHFRYSTQLKGLVLTILNNILELDVTYITYSHVSDEGRCMRFTPDNKDGIEYELKEDESFNYDKYAKRIQKETGIPIYELHRYLKDEVTTTIDFERTADMEMSDENLEPLKDLLVETLGDNHDRN